MKDLNYSEYTPPAVSPGPSEELVRWTADTAARIARFAERNRCLGLANKALDATREELAQVAGQLNLLGASCVHRVLQDQVELLTALRDDIAQGTPVNTTPVNTTPVDNHPAWQCVERVSQRARRLHVPKLSETLDTEHDYKHENPRLLVGWVPDSQGLRAYLEGDEGWDAANSSGNSGIWVTGKRRR